MLNLQFVREHPEAVRKALRDRSLDERGLDELLSLDEERRRLLSRVETLKAERNVIGRSTGSAPVEERPQLIEQGRILSALIGESDPRIKAIDDQVRGLLLDLPNIPHPDAPVGEDEEQNVIVREEGKPPTFDFEPRPHWDIGERSASSTSSAA